MALHSSQRFAVRLLTVLAFVLGGWSAVCAKSEPVLKGASPAVIDSGLNVVRIRFDTLKLQPGQHDVLLPVRWSYSLPKPHDFRAFNVHFSVDSTKVTIVDFMQQGTATDQSFMGSDAFTNANPADARFVILGSHEPDFNNPILFFVRVSVQLNPGEVAPFHWTYIEDPKYFKVDTIIAEDGWIALVAAKPAAITSKDTSMGSDSDISVPIRISDLIGTGVTQARITATLDTSVFEFVGATPGAAQNAQVVAELTGNVLTVDISAASSATLLGNTTLVNVRLHSRARKDTVCSAFTNGSFQALNSGAYIGSVSTFFGEICVYGSQPSSVIRPESVERLEVFPNPASTVVHLAGASVPVSLTVYDILGREVYSSTSVQDWIPSPALVNGCYHLVVEELGGKRRAADITIVR